MSNLLDGWEIWVDEKGRKVNEGRANEGVIYGFRHKGLDMDFAIAIDEINKKAVTKPVGKNINYPLVEEVVMEFINHHIKPYTY